MYRPYSIAGLRLGLANPNPEPTRTRARARARARTRTRTRTQERAQLAALGGAAPTRTDPQTVQGLKGQLTKEFKQSFALLVDKNAPRPSDALSDID